VPGAFCKRPRGNPKQSPCKKNEQENTTLGFYQNGYKQKFECFTNMRDSWFEEMTELSE
jgi:hypothetical protein